MTWPTSPQLAGASLTVTYTIFNGGTSGYVDVWLNNGAALLGTNNHYIASATSVNGNFPWTMASADMAMKLSSSNGGSNSKTIQVLIQINTTLTLALDPTSIRIGKTVTASGYLSRNDNPQNYVGVSGATVKLLKSDGTLVKSGTATSSGGYSIPFTAPSTVGTYKYKSYFAGAGPLASAESMARSIGIGDEDFFPPWLTILAPLATGIALIKVIRR